MWVLQVSNKETKLDSQTRVWIEVHKESCWKDNEARCKESQETRRTVYFIWYGAVEETGIQEIIRFCDQCVLYCVWKFDKASRSFAEYEQHRLLEIN